MAYQKWFLRRPDLLQEEFQAFSETGLDFQIDEQRRDEDQVIEFTGTVKIAERDVIVDLVYPAEFPHFPIMISAKETNLSRHQNPFFKNLCVIPHNQDGWETWMTGAYMVKQAVKLLSDSAAGEETVYANEVDAPEPWSNYIQFRGLPVYVAGQIPNDTPSLGTFEIVTYPGQHVFENERDCPIIHQFDALEVLQAPGWKNEFDKPFMFQESPTKGKPKAGNWFRLPQPPDFNLYDTDELFRALERHFPLESQLTFQLRQQFRMVQKTKSNKRKSMPTPHLALLFPEENYERGTFRTTFLWGTYCYDTKEMGWSPTQFFSIDEHFRRIPDLAPLYYEPVLVVGVGSLGSAVALELGKSGVGSLTLVDFDRLESGNLSRHTGSIPDLGMPKTKIVAAQVRSHFPYCNVEALHLCLGRVDPSTKDDGSFQTIYEKMKKANLVIDTSADSRVTLMLNRFAVELGVPIVHSWVTNGAWGGRVIRFVPDKTGCYNCFANSSPEDVDSAPIGEIYPGGCGFPTFTGASYDIYELATHTVRMACNTLLNRDVNFDHILVQHNPPLVRTFPIVQSPDCPVCRDRADV